MKKIILCLLCLIISFNCSFAYTENDLLDALNKTYTVNGESFSLPSSIKNKAVNYIKANDITEEQCNELMAVLNEGIAFANKIGTTDISKLTTEQLKEGIAIVNKAAKILEMEVKVNSTLDKVTATDKDTGKIIEEVEKKDVFFKATGKERNNILWTSVGFAGLILIIIAYVVLVRVIKYNHMDFICNTVMLLYIICAMPIICFGYYLEILELLEPFVSSEVGDGYVDIVEVEINKPVEEDNVVTNEENNKTENKVESNVKEDNKVEEKVTVKYPVVGEMYAKLSIPTCDINLSVYYGDNEKILEAGVGHFSGSHFPGEGKGILYTAHNTIDKLYNLKSIKKGDKVEVLTTFGSFEYKVVKTEVIQDTDQKKAKIENDKELLMIYTCYPFDADKYTDKRFMVYCERSDV